MNDIYAGEGVAVIDPHGDLAEDIRIDGRFIPIPRDNLQNLSHFQD
jgi:hypothetical protein